MCFVNKRKIIRKKNEIQKYNNFGLTKNDTKMFQQPFIYLPSVTPKA